MQSGILNCIMVSHDSINLNLYFCTSKGKLGAYFLFDICLSLTHSFLMLTSSKLFRKCNTREEISNP